MGVKLTKGDWEEIYYALETKRRMLESRESGEEDDPGEDEEWAAHLKGIQEVIGPDGEGAAEKGVDRAVENAKVGGG